MYHNLIIHSISTLNPTYKNPPQLRALPFHGMILSMSLPEIITPELQAFIRQHYRLDWDGLHGYNHWLRVLENGLRVAEQTGADRDVVALFAFTHDMDRHSDGWDLNHGPRAAHLIKNDLQGRLIHLAEDRLARLVAAVHGHTGGRTHPDITVLTCWDADRLDIGRVGTPPNPRYLCTPAARDPQLIAWALARSQTSF